MAEPIETAEDDFDDDYDRYDRHYHWCNDWEDDEDYLWPDSEPTRWEMWKFELLNGFYNVRFWITKRLHRIVKRCDHCGKRMWFQPLEEVCCCQKCYDEWVPF